MRNDPRHSRRTPVESLETRLLLSDVPPEKFVDPVVGREGIDWVMSAYFDDDPTTGVATDYQGGQYTYDGCNQTHFAIADFAAMDRGVGVVAVAGGTVVEAHDGEASDRDAGRTNPPKSPDNYVLIDHGNGWQTRYGRLRNESVLVSPGQSVVAGQPIGQVGGSGNGDSPNYYEGATWLRFQVIHEGAFVDPFLDPNAFWQSPPAYAGDTPGVWYVTALAGAQPPFTEVFEHTPQRHVFHPGESVVGWIPGHGINQGRDTVVRFLRPDGTVFSDGDFVAPIDRPFIWRTDDVTLPTSAPLGEWKIQLLLDGDPKALATGTFTVAERAEGRPEIKVYQGTTYIIDGRTTPIDFGRADQGSTTTLRKSFSVQNFGTQPLTIDRIELPEGFSIVGTPPASVLPNNPRTITVQLDTRAAGAKAGQVVIHTNDAEEGEFNFAVKGTVTAVPAAVAGRHVAYAGLQSGSEPGAIDHSIAPDKQALLPGQTPSFANVTSYVRGIDGVVIDVQRLPAGEGLSAADFVLATDAGSAPAPTGVAVLRGAGEGGSDRIALTWSDAVIKNTWLNVTVLATPRTGLSAPDVFSFGNLVGDTGDSEAGPFRVNALDLAAVKRAMNTSSDLTGRFDFNRDGRVNALDLAAVRGNLNQSLASPAVGVRQAPLPSLSLAAAPQAREGQLSVRRVWDEEDTVLP